MDIGGMFGNQAIGGLAVRNLDLAVMAGLLTRQAITRVEPTNGGGAGAQPGRGAETTSRGSAPPQGADEPGKGTLVDVTC